MNRLLLAGVIVLAGCHSEPAKYFANGVSEGANNYYTFTISPEKVVMVNYGINYTEIWLKSEHGYCLHNDVGHSCINVSNPENIVLWTMDGTNRNPDTETPDYQDTANTIHYIKVN